MRALGNMASTALRAYARKRLSATDAPRAGPPPAPTGDEWSFVVLPDTQRYAAHFPSIFAAQTDWLARHARTRRIQFAVHVGDVVDAHQHRQWRVAASSLARLNGALPYVIAPGNHDYAGNGGSRTTHLNEYVRAATLLAGADDAGTFEPGRVDNTYRCMSTPCGPWLALALEFGPRPAVLDWAAAVIAARRHMPVVLATHAHLYSDGTRYDRTRRRYQRWSPYNYAVASSPGGVTDGAHLWRRLVEPNANIAFVVSGHILGGGMARRTTLRAGGTPVHEMVGNYQRYPAGGSGFFRIVRVAPANQSYRVYTYSPWLDRCLCAPAHQFDLAGSTYILRRHG